jgi:hypothetical protein
MRRKIRAGCTLNSFVSLRIRSPLNNVDIRAYVADYEEA